MLDLVIRNGLVVDGTGAPARKADVAISDGVVAAVGEINDIGREEIDADGLLVTPGFVDIHTHFDGQITWDPLLTPSFWHGVTTVVFGNCGVGFAPAAPNRREWLIGLMEGVEDIPGSALAEGIQWNWESFPEYLDFLDTLPKAIDIGTQVPHGAVRAYVMGDRGARNEDANPEDIQEMAAIVKEGLEAGALGFSTSRTLAHRAIDGEPVPGTFAAEDELFGIGRALKEVGAGVYEVAPAGVTGDDANAPELEIAWMRKLSAEIERPVSFAMVQFDNDPEAWRDALDRSLEALEDGAELYPQVAARGISLLLTLRGRHPFIHSPSYRELDDLDWAERAEAMRDPQRKEQILAEVEAPDAALGFIMWHKLYPMSNPPNYEPTAEESVAACAEAAGQTPLEFAYDFLSHGDGENVLFAPLFNYAHNNLDATREMMLHPRVAMGLSDGGAHCGVICDAGMPTFMLTHWSRDRSRGETLPLEWVVKRMTQDTAQLYGLGDRGTLEVGKKGDVNVIDYDALQLEQPEAVHDLPTDAMRLIQKSRGYVATIVSGEVISRHGEETGARPGQLIRGAR
ncbi:MAG: amidohydrolase family protein [Chloroflexi bacterium]|nr:amidohydrolase family protein [Chloroflexota bacterium]MCY3696508.1 amidohydrolase family protein [Chloroflexota bacterium]